jgi:hypothetical protein
MHFKQLILAAALGTAITAPAAPAAAQVYGHVGINIGPPPAPVVERVPVAPGPGYVWRGGHWRWNGRRYVWAPGFYARRPYARAAWIRGHWVQTGHGWVYREGHWS